MNFREAMEFIQSTDGKMDKYTLENIKKLLNELGNPQEKLNFIHVGGTNGKGSVSAYISYILAANGYKVGRYISPTIRTYQERIQTLEEIGNKMVETNISEDAVCKWMEKIKEACENIKKMGGEIPTPFEIETAMGFLEFIEQNCNVVVLEVGMGGITDATNVIKTSCCTVLTSISLDHQNILGDTLSQITKQKAGIIKEHGSVVGYDYSAWSKARGVQDEITPILLEQGKKKQAEIGFADFSKIQNVSHSLQGVGFSYKDMEEIYTRLLGKYQVENAVLAIEAAYLLERKGWQITKENIKRGIALTKWKGRFELVLEKPIYIIDGAHNRDGARALGESINIYLENKKILYVMGILADKDYESVLSYTGKYASKIITVTPDNNRALPADALGRIAGKFCKNVDVAETVYQGLEMAKQEEAQYDAVIIFGSLYFLHTVYDYLEER